MFFEQLANSGSYNRIIAVNRVGRPSHRMWRRQHQNQRLLRLKSAIFLLKRRLLCCSEQLDWDRRGNEWDGYVAKGCTRALKTTRATDRSVYRNWWKNRQDPHMLCVQLSFPWSAMLSRALASVASPNSPGAGLFTVFNNPCTNPKISFSQLLALLSLSCEISDATNSDTQFAFRQCSLTTKLKYSCQMFLWQSKKIS